MLRFLTLVVVLGPLSLPAAEVPLIVGSAEWAWLADGSDAGSAWRQPAFDASGWASGQAELGYGDGDERTVVPFGPNASQKYVTTYFRHRFFVTDPAPFDGLTLRTRRDDGAVVYLNGVEVWRSNLPAGTIAFDTLASAPVSGADETTFSTTTADPTLLVAGPNVVAVEIHQSTRDSSDISFALELSGSSETPVAVVTRGPYLQNGSPNRVVVRWRTNIPTDSRVRYGTIAGAPDLSAGAVTATTEHEVLLDGLSPGTRYFYSIGTAAGTLAGGDSSYAFTTAPLPGSAGPTRIWVIGDSGTANSDAVGVRNAYLDFGGAIPTSLWLMLGDNAYDNGTDAEYQSAVFEMYPMILRSSVLWPALGNHDTAQLQTVPPTIPYFNLFSLPTAGEAGGLPSGTEKYYSFDYANIHFVCLDSMTSDRTSTGPMLTWLRADLAETSQRWIIAYWHHPPYSKGSHDSDVDPQLVEMRQNALPILEDAGVDLVLSGHSHSYERSFLIDSHYGSSSTITSGMIKDGGDGRPGGTGAYSKGTGSLAPHEGAVYAVAGSSGKVTPAPLNHPAKFLSLAVLGSMVLDVNDGRLDATFLRDDGTVADTFTILKDPAPSGTSLHLVNPCRLLDSRSGPPLAGNATRTVSIGGQCGIPATARATALNVTAVSPTGSGFLTLFPSLTDRPSTSTLNYRSQKTRANNALIPLSSGSGTVDVFNGGASPIHFIIDVTGYFE